MTSVSQLKAAAAEVRSDYRPAQVDALLDLVDEMPDDGVVVPRAQLEKLRAAWLTWDEKFGGPHAGAEACDMEPGPCICGLHDAEEAIVALSAVLR